MRTIFKYPLEITDKQTIRMKCVSILHVGLDPSKRPCLWAEVETDAIESGVDIYVVGTGNPLPDLAEYHIGSFVQGPFVRHVYR
jgi:hypothetical protein